MKKLILYSNSIKNVSGLQTFEYTFIQTFKDLYEITVVFETGDIEQVKRFGELVKVERNTGGRYIADTCVYSSANHANFNCRAGKYIQIVHADYVFWGVKYDPDNVDVHVAVSPYIQEVMKKYYGVDAVVIPNLIPRYNPAPFMRFMVATRLSKGKGMERLKRFAQILKSEGMQFIVEVHGDGSKMDLDAFKMMFEDIPAVAHVGVNTNIMNYMKNVDYVLQFSDNEAFCYTVYEALQVGTPVIVTNWDGVQNIVTHGENGYIIDKQMVDVPVNDIYFKKPEVSEVLAHYKKHAPILSDQKDLWQAIL